MRLLILLFILIKFFSFNQKEKSDSNFEYKYFKNGKISTKRLLLSNKIHFGFLKAYKIDGTEIYSMSTRNIGGHCSVDVEYYPSGAIKKAHATDQPDGGIQHGDVTHYFDEEGNITNIVDLSDDGWGRTVTYPDFKKVDQPVVTPKIDKKPEVVSCAIIYSSEIFVVNLTRKPQIIISKKLHQMELDLEKKRLLIQEIQFYLEVIMKHNFSLQLQQFLVLKLNSSKIKVIPFILSGIISFKHLPC